MVDEHWDVHFGLHKARGDQVGGKAEVLSPRCLLKALEAIVEPAHQVGVSGLNEAGGLVVVVCLSEDVMEEEVFNI
jgi:hypothetical protein